MDWVWRKSLHFFSLPKGLQCINVLLSLKYNERFCVCKCVCECVCETRLGLLSLHYTRAGSTPVLCPRSLPLPVPARNNELQWMPWGGWVSGSEVDSILAQITSQIHSNGSLGLLSAFSAYSCLRVKWSIHTFSPFKWLWFSFWSQFLQCSGWNHGEKTPNK